MSSSNVTAISQNWSDNLAIVTEIDQWGKASKVEYHQQVVSTYGQLQHVSALAIGDQVLIQQTHSGVIITGVLAKPNQPPAASINDDQGQIIIKADKSVALATAKGFIQVNANGEISIDGKTVIAVSEEDMTLAGWPIRLN
ncbi:hypothetical protein HR060_13740 [Catenovulum sp. SM1970]|uniref:hypothetical protein n=1 Tax=Marinifaba aquimaris TaxID=2741323 RepID=UPI001571B737|nr:hypothetical protein [Marinifaba aquimaris]NTS77917.1 hypothetical protein [Marinifaba aquimaris]